MRPKSDLPNAPSQWRWQSDTVHSGGCGTDADVFALLVMGESMTPEVEDGDVIIVHVRDGRRDRLKEDQL